MKPIRIYYEKCFSLGNYENEKIGVEVELSEGETATEAINTAMRFVEKSTTKKNSNLVRARMILDEKDRYTYTQVIEAEKIIKESEPINDLLF